MRERVKQSKAIMTLFLDLEVLETSLSIQTHKDGKPKKKPRKVRILDPVAPQPLLGIKLLVFMLNERITNTIILENHMEDVLTVKKLLKNSMVRDFHLFYQIQTTWWLFIS